MSSSSNGNKKCIDYSLIDLDKTGGDWTGSGFMRITDEGFQEMNFNQMSDEAIRFIYFVNNFNSETAAARAVFDLCKPFYVEI